jgi:hypothetical protein
MTLELFSATTTAQYNPGPGQYGLDPYRSIGGPLSLKSSFGPRPSDRPMRSMAPEAELLGPGTTLNRSGKTIGRRFPEARKPAEDIGPYFLPDPNEGFTRYVKIKSRYETPSVKGGKRPVGTPGPGEYSPKKEWPKTVTPPMGPRPDIILAETSGSPGPAAYEISRNLGDNARKWTIRPMTAPESVIKEDPGYKYCNPSVLGGDCRKINLPPHLGVKSRELCDGGSKGYGAQSRSRSRNEYYTDVPGPGTYSVNKYMSNQRIAPSIHPIIVNNIGVKEDVPYVDVRSFPDGRQRSIHVKTGDSGTVWATDRAVPGPGWVPDSCLERRNITIRNRFEEKGAGQGTPGPGTYNVTSFGAKRGDTIRAFTMKGPAERNDWLPRSAADLPGPGEYYAPSDNGLPKWTIGYRSIGTSVRRSVSSLSGLSMASRQSQPSG